jgi:hypothetical protein
MSDETKLLVALVTALASAIVSLLGFWVTRSTQTRVERLRAELAGKSAEKTAQLQYEFEARKELYKIVAPLLFQLVEAAEAAAARIELLLGPGSGVADPALLLANDGFLQSTYYKLLRPPALVHLLSQNIRELDLSLDPSMLRIYRIARVIENAFTDDHKFARIAGLPYAPNETDDDADWQQGVDTALLDECLEWLAPVGPPASAVSFGQFKRAIADPESPGSRIYKGLRYLFFHYRPEDRPVLWGLLLAQLCLYRGLAAAKSGVPPVAVPVTLELPEMALGGLSVDEMIANAAEYLRVRTRDSGLVFTIRRTGGEKRRDRQHAARGIASLLDARDAVGADQR